MQPPPCPQHPVEVQGPGQTQPSLQREPTPQALPAGFTRRGRAAAQGQHVADTRNPSRAPNMQGNTSLRTGLWMLPLLQPQWSFPRAQDRGTPGIAGTLASHTPPLSEGAGMHGLHTHPWCASRQRSHTHMEHRLTLQHAGRAGCMAAGLEKQLLSAPGSASSPRPRSSLYLGGCSRGEVGQAPRRGG